jgi:hypothetical protein
MTDNDPYDMITYQWPCSGLHGSAAQPGTSRGTLGQISLTEPVLLPN